MKQVFKCDFCSFMGTKKDVKDHESKCTSNYNLRSCYTCKHAHIHFGKDYKSFLYECKKGKELPENHFCKHCDQYEDKEDRTTPNSPYSKYANFFGDIFGSNFRGVL